MKRWQQFVLATIICFAFHSPAQAKGLFSRIRHYAGHHQRPAVSYDQQYRYLNWRYPKYTGAFHYSYFRDIGVAPGDVGFRTNGVLRTPW